MLSLLLTAVLVLGALVAALHLRSAWRALAVLALAGAGLVLLGRRTLDGLAIPRLHLVYEIDTEHALDPGPDLPARTAAAVQARVDRLGLGGAEVKAVGDTVDLVAPFDDETYTTARSAIPAVGLVEFVEVDDDADPFEAVERDFEPVGRGSRIQLENVPLGPGKTAPRRYAFLHRFEEESMLDALGRLQKGVKTIGIREDQRFAFEKVLEFDPDLGRWDELGWRTFLLKRRALLTGRDIQNAVAQPDTSQMSLGGWLVALEFTSEGGRLFEEATGRLIKRRFAIVVDGIVQSAPVVQTRIGGGRGVITMGAGSLDEQATNAKSLEAVLRSGALPAPLLLAREDRVEAPLARSVMAGLTGAAGLLLLAVVALACWMAFRPARGVTAPPAPAAPRTGDRP